MSQLVHQNCDTPRTPERICTAHHEACRSMSKRDGASLRRRNCSCPHLGRKVKYRISGSQLIREQEGVVQEKSRGARLLIWSQVADTKVDFARMLPIYNNKIDQLNLFVMNLKISKTGDSRRRSLKTNNSTQEKRKRKYKIWYRDERWKQASILQHQQNGWNVFATTYEDKFEATRCLTSQRTTNSTKVFAKLNWQKNEETFWNR